MRSINKQTVFILLTPFGVIFFIELALTFISMASPNISSILSSPGGTLIPDKQLGVRLNPAYPGHDRKGFRNSQVPESTDIISFGDSQTYGTGVESAEAWPRVLELLSGRKVYSMAVGGYGPPHSLILWDEAMMYQPKIVIEAVYSGNDLFDSFNLVYERGQLPELKTNDPAVQEEIAGQEKLETLNHRVVQMFQMTQGVSQEGFTASIIKFISNYSKLYGFLERAGYEIDRRVIRLHGKRQPEIPESMQWEEAKDLAKEKLEFFEMFDNGQVRTFFTPQYRLAALDLQDPRIREGQQILLKAAQEMNDLGQKRGIRFIVLFIPTKEFVFRNIVQNPSASYRTLVDNEEKFWNSTENFLKKHNVEFINALPALQEQLKSGNQPYPLTGNGHLNKFGHKAIAELLNRQIKHYDHKK